MENWRGRGRGRGGRGPCDPSPGGLMEGGWKGIRKEYTTRDPRVHLDDGSKDGGWDSIWRDGALTLHVFILHSARTRRSYALPSIPRARRKRGLNKYSTTLADRARDFSCLREGTRGIAGGTKRRKGKEEGWRIVQRSGRAGAGLMVF